VRETRSRFTLHQAINRQARPNAQHRPPCVAGNSKSLARIHKPRLAAKVIYAQETMAAPGLQTIMLVAKGHARCKRPCSLQKVMLGIVMVGRPLILGVTVIGLSASTIDCPRDAEATSGARAHSRWAKGDGE